MRYPVEGSFYILQTLMFVLFVLFICLTWGGWGHVARGPAQIEHTTPVCHPGWQRPALFAFELLEYARYMRNNRKKKHPWLPCSSAYCYMRSEGGSEVAKPLPSRRRNS